MASFDAYLQETKQEEQKRPPWNPGPSTSSGSRFAFPRIDETTVDLSMAATSATAEPLSSSSSSTTSSSFGPSGSSSASTAVALHPHTNPSALEKAAGSSQHMQQTGLPEPTAVDDGGQQYIIHTVSKFDTLAGLAIRYNVQVAQLKRINRLTTDFQMFALGTIRIPLPQAGAQEEPVPSPRDRSPFPQQSRDLGRPLSSGSGRPTTGRESGGAAAAAAAAGREAVLASAQLVEAIDPELLMGVKGLRTAAEDVDGYAGFGSGMGANTVALLMALQHQNRATGPGTGHLGHRILAGSNLSLSSSSEQLDDIALGRARAGSGARPLFGTSWGGAGAPGGLGGAEGASRQGHRGSLFADEEIDVQGEMARYYQRSHQKGSNARTFWGQGVEAGMGELRGDAARSMSQRGMLPGPGGEFSGALSDSSVPSSVGYTAEQMRRRGNPRSLEDAELSSGEDTDGWNSGDEYYAPHAGMRQGGGSGAIPRGSAGARGMTGAWSASRAGGRPSSMSFESLEGLGAASTVATQWGSRMLDGLISGLRNGGSWLANKGAGGETAAGRGGHGLQDAGIDLPVLSRGVGPGDGSTGFRGSYGEVSLGGSVRDATSARVSGSGGSTMRRSSKPRPSVE